MSIDRVLVPLGVPLLVVSAMLAAVARLLWAAQSHLGGRVTTSHKATLSDVGPCFSDP